MKAALKGTLLFVLFIVFGCESPPTALDELAEEGAYTGKAGDLVSEFEAGTLVAAQDIPVGIVDVDTVGGVSMTYRISEDGWCLTETHLQVAEDVSLVPQTKNGSPIPGKFDLTASSAGIVMTASPTQFVARISIRWIFDLSRGFPISEYHFFSRQDEQHEKDKYLVHHSNDSYVDRILFLTN